MFNRSEILRTAWAKYARDKHTGIISRKGPFNRAHFAYCLRMEWTIAKAAAVKAAALVAEREALIAEATALNAHPALRHSDFVADMRSGGIEKCRVHVDCMREFVANADRAPAVAARMAAIVTELHDQEFDDRIDWTRRVALRGELAQLQAA